MLEGNGGLLALRPDAALRREAAGAADEQQLGVKRAVILACPARMRRRAYTGISAGFHEDRTIQGIAPGSQITLIVAR